MFKRHCRLVSFPTAERNIFGNTVLKFGKGTVLVSEWLAEFLDADKKGSQQMANI